jgi:hypothetical protein
LDPLGERAHSKHKLINYQAGSTIYVLYNFQRGVEEVILIVSALLFITQSMSRMLGKMLLKVKLAQKTHARSKKLKLDTQSLPFLKIYTFIGATAVNFLLFQPFKIESELITIDSLLIFCDFIEKRKYLLCN